MGTSRCRSDRRPPRLVAAVALALSAALGAASACRADQFADLARPKEGRSMRATSARRGPDGAFAHENQDAEDVKPGATAVLLDADGPGAITHIWFTFRGPETSQWPEGVANHQELLLRIYYDGSDRPGVEAPIGDFFACGFGRRSEVISLPVVVEDGDSYNCFWRMPFRRHVRVEVVNESERTLRGLYHAIDWLKLDALADDTPYFYAQYRQEYPVEQGTDYVLLETEGEGHYVGTVLSVRMRSPSWFGEGDEKITIDGEERPSIWGTGTEDYFLSAWGLKKASTPYFGTPCFDLRGPGGHVCSYRWHLEDPVVFHTGIRVAIEHWGWVSPDENPQYRSTSWNERQDDYASVAFWYQTGAPTFAARAPHARERALPSLDRVFTVTESVARGSGACRLQKAHWLEGEQVLYAPQDADSAWVEIPFTVETKEPRRLVVRGTRASDYGTYQAFLNGVKIGPPMNGYAEAITDWEWHLLDFWPEPGEYTLRLECIGNDRRSTGFLLGLESLRLRERRPRVAEWAFDRDKDWRTDPILYR